jgi:UDP-N-acetylmuramoyl-tripeptide--D-alanyl-D-alanine ligase
MGTLEKTRDEKADMLRILPPDGIAIVNGDDENVRWMATQTRARVVYIGEAEDAEVRATDIELEWPTGMKFVARAGAESWPVVTRLIGRHMVFPALAAITVAYLEQLPMAQAIAALARLEPTPGRMQTMRLTSGAYAVRDEFKGSEHTFESAFAALAEIPAQKRIGVIGGISEEHGRQAYRDVGAGAAKVLDRVVYVGTTKNMATFRAGATKQGMQAECIDHVHTWIEARDRVRELIEADDIVFIKGRWQQALGRVGLSLAGRDVRCRADPCPFKRMLCDVCPFLEQEFYGLGVSVDQTT